MVELFSHDKELMEFLGVEVQQTDLFSDGKIVKKETSKIKGKEKIVAVS